MRSRHVTLPLAPMLAVAALALWPQAASAQRSYYAQPDYGLPRVTGALRVGLDVPSGRAFSGMPLEELFGPQLGLLGELGVRVNPQVTFGGYLGFGFGSAGDRFDGFCNGSDCAAYSLRAGVMAQYAFAPWATMSPWIGYGFGFTASVANGDDRGLEFSYSYAGFDLAHLMAGVDLRPSGRVGIGFYADYSVGVYRAYHWDEDDVTIADGSIGDSKIHHWFSFGPRISF
jgi:hypothetical protein